MCQKQSKYSENACCFPFHLSALAVQLLLGPRHPAPRLEQAVRVRVHVDALQVVEAGLVQAATCVRAGGGGNKEKSYGEWVFRFRAARP